MIAPHGDTPIDGGKKTMAEAQTTEAERGGALELCDGGCGIGPQCPCDRCISKFRKSLTTKRIRLLVMIDPDGKWEALGSHSYSDKQTIDELGNCCGDLGLPPWGYHWIEADIPIPVERSEDAIEGHVTEAADVQ